MEYIQINTSQNVKISFLKASIGLRMLSFFIDNLIKVVFYMIISFAATKVGVYELFEDYWSKIAIYVIILLPITFYSLFFESIMEGQTPGKKWLNIKVIKIDGYQARFSDYLIRWFFALVDFYISSGAVAIISIISSEKSQRLGGLASGTTVINLKNKVTINQTILQKTSNEHQVQFPNVLILNDQDVQVIKSQFNKAIKINDLKIIKTLAIKVSEIIKSDPKGMTHVNFIRTVLNDYSYLSAKEK